MIDFGIALAGLSGAAAIIKATSKLALAHAEQEKKKELDYKKKKNKLKGLYVRQITIADESLGRAMAVEELLSQGKMSPAEYGEYIVECMRNGEKLNEISPVDESGNPDTSGEVYLRNKTRYQTEALRALGELLK